MRQLHIRISDELDQWLEEEARRRIVSKTFLIERAVEELREREEVGAR